MGNKLKELLIEIAHEAAQVILAADETSARESLEKIHASIASALTVDQGGTTAQRGGGSGTLFLKREPKLKAIKRVATTPQTIVFETTLAHGRKLSAQWSSESTSSNATTDLWDGHKHVAEIIFFTQYQGRSWGRKITNYALKGLASRAGRKTRQNRNKKEVA